MNRQSGGDPKARRRGVMNDCPPQGCFLTLCVVMNPAEGQVTEQVKIDEEAKVSVYL